MQINIDKKTGTFLGIIVALVLAVVFLLAGNSSMPMDHSSHGTAMSSDETMFAQKMIPHHEQAVTMSELALENTANPDVIALATAIRDAQGPEIEQMKSWLDGKSESHMHDMEMGGMLTEAELKELKLFEAPSVEPVPTNGANVEFVVPNDPMVKDGVGYFSFRVHERGVGETLSCGTGIAAAALATRYWAGPSAPNQWQVQALGGLVAVRMFATEDGEMVGLSGAAELVFDGQIDLEQI